MIKIKFVSLKLFEGSKCENFFNIIEGIIMKKVEKRRKEIVIKNLKIMGVGLAM